MDTVVTTLVQAAKYEYEVVDPQGRPVKGEAKLTEQLTPIILSGVGPATPTQGLSINLPTFYDVLGVVTDSNNPITEKSNTWYVTQMQWFVEENNVRYYLSTKVYSVMQISNGLMVRNQEIVAVP